MNARANLITAMVTLSLIVPAAASAASSNRPWDVSLSKPTVPHLHLLKASSSTIGLRTYNAWAYVQGGASQKVAKAITAAATTRTGNPCVSQAQRRVPC